MIINNQKFYKTHVDGSFLLNSEQFNFVYDELVF